MKKKNKKQNKFYNQKGKFYIGKNSFYYYLTCEKEIIWV